MERKRKLFWAKTGILAVAIPVVVWAYEYGPDPGYCNVPKENGTCLGAGCHVGSMNPAGGGVNVTFPNGLAYTPGVKQHLVVTITDASTAPRAWGFQLTARTAANSATMAGSFSPSDTNTQVMCSQPNLGVFGAVCLPGANNGNPSFCTASSTPVCGSGYTLQYAEHSYSGYLHNRQQISPATYEFDWTPPATNVGNIQIYVAANSGPSTSVATQDSADIYTATPYTLTPAAAGGGGNAPMVTDVQNGASFQSGIVPGSWITIKGSNFTAASFTDTWANSIVNGKLPTTLDGITVNVGGQNAYVYYVSANQINAVAPGTGTGSMQVTVTANNTTSSAISASSLAVQPAFFLWNGKYAVATHLDGTLAAANGTFPGATTVPAKPGDYVILWGTGFGPTSPAAPSGVVTPSDQTYLTASPVSVTVGGAPATVYSNAAVLTPTLAAVYQVAVQIPSTAANGDLPVVATINGAQTPTGVSISVHN